MLNIPIMMPKLSLLRPAGHPDEDQLLNGIWIGLLSVEALMVLGVALRSLVGAVSASGFWQLWPAAARRRSVGAVPPACPR